MKVAYLSKSDSFGGGASKCAEDLTIYLNSDGETAVHIYYWAGKGFSAQRIPLIGHFF